MLLTVASAAMLEPSNVGRLFVAAFPPNQASSNAQESVSVAEWSCQKARLIAGRGSAVPYFPLRAALWISIAALSTSVQDDALVYLRDLPNLASAFAVFSSVSDPSG